MIELYEYIYHHIWEEWRIENCFSKSGEEKKEIFIFEKTRLLDWPLNRHRTKGSYENMRQDWIDRYEMLNDTRETLVTAKSRPLASLSLTPPLPLRAYERANIFLCLHAALFSA